VFEAPAPEPVAAAPQKTVMLGIGGDDEGFPIVGWVVPLTGPNQFQTFKLLQGQTIIGTGDKAHVVVTDTFMSTEHAQILCSPVGFILQDGGSTNGTMVNQRRVDKHELVDNDVFTLGKTDFKFKSIN
jgi:pSer/pThr/pTyr-binding forkhead associated (FHA) protein